VRRLTAATDLQRLLQRSTPDSLAGGGGGLLPPQEPHPLWVFGLDFLAFVLGRQKNRGHALMVANAVVEVRGQGGQPPFSDLSPPAIVRAR